jgi:hypothetical protein
MSSLSIRCTIVLLGALLGSAALSAAGRTSDAREPTGKKSSNAAAKRSDTWRQDLEAWLARLNGSFKIKLEIPPEVKCTTINQNNPANTSQKCTATITRPYVSAVNCRGIGQGPGLYCTFDELRHEPTGKDGGTPGSPVSMFSNGLPSRMLLGIDPVAQKISMMVMNPGAPGFSGMAAPEGDSVTFKGRCDAAVQKASSVCSWNLSMRAPRDGHRVVMTLSNSRGGSSSFNAPHAFVLTRPE